MHIHDRMDLAGSVEMEVLMLQFHFCRAGFGFFSPPSSLLGLSLQRSSWVKFVIIHILSAGHTA